MTEKYENLIDFFNLEKLKILDKLLLKDILLITNITTKILLLCYYNYLDEIKKININILKNITHIKYNLYLWSSIFGNIELMEYLESIGFDIFIKDQYGNNAYLLASEYDHIKVMEYLEKKGFDIFITNFYNENAYLIASFYGKI